jgi:hypothetical protein
MQKIDLKILKVQHVFISLQYGKLVSEMLSACLHAYGHISVCACVWVRMCLLVEPEWFDRFSSYLVL